jgi:hypothetical protein
VWCLEIQRELLLVAKQMLYQREYGSQSVILAHFLVLLPPQYLAQHPPTHPILPPQYLAQYLPPYQILTTILFTTLTQTLTLLPTSTLILVLRLINGLFVPEGEPTKMDR